MIAVLFFVAVGVIIGAGLGYGWGHTAGMAEGYHQGKAERREREVDATLALHPIESRQVAGEGVWPQGYHFEGECWEPPLYDFEAER